MKDNYLENFVNDIMKDPLLETPSFDFTTKVMSQIQANKTSEVFVYKQLIPKPILFLFLGSFILLFLYILIAGESKSDNWLTRININRFYNYQISTLFIYSKITIYSVVFATLMFLFQISFLKNHFNNQFQKLNT